MEGMNWKGWGMLERARSGRGTPSTTQLRWKTHRVDIFGGEKWWLLPEAGQDERREHQGKVDVEGGEAEGVQDLALGAQWGRTSECQAPPG